MKEKILCFVKTPPPITGATLMNQYVCKSKLLSETFDFRLLEISYKLRIDDVSIFSLGKMQKIVHLHYRILKLLMTFGPRVVYFQISPLGLAFYRDCTYVLWFKLFRKHLVLHLHGKGIKEASQKSIINRMFYRWAFKGVSVICLSESLSSDVASIYIGSPYIVNNGIPDISQKDIVVQRKSEKVRILFLSNLIVSKGIFDFLDAMELLNKSGESNFYSSIAGLDTEISASQLAFEIGKRGLQSIVSYLGPKYNDEKDNLYRNTDILVYPTLNDVWGLVILEAMKFGIPVIATREGAIPEIVEDGSTGLLVEKSSPMQIAENVILLINDPILRRRMGDAGRAKFLERYTLDTFEESMKEVFERILTTLESTKGS